jgi:zinc and cadmium transporter
VTELLWIVAGGLLMSVIALSGSITLILKPATLKALLLPLVALAAGSLIGGAFFHLLPAAIAGRSNGGAVWIAAVLGFTVFFILEQLLHWHHCHQAAEQRPKPLTYLILVGDGLHNLIGGMAIGSAFLIDIRLGISSWFAAALHEVPQELGDFGVLVHGGWDKRRALAFNFLSGLTFLVGGLVSYAVSFEIDISLLIPFAAGNFLYIGAADLIPEVNREAATKINGIHLLAFIVGLLLLWSASIVSTV